MDKKYLEKVYEHLILLEESKVEDHNEKIESKTIFQLFFNEIVSISLGFIFCSSFLSFILFSLFFHFCTFLFLCSVSKDYDQRVSYTLNFQKNDNIKSLLAVSYGVIPFLLFFQLLILKFKSHLYNIKNNIPKNDLKEKIGNDIYDLKNSEELIVYLIEKKQRSKEEDYIYKNIVIPFLREKSQELNKKNHFTPEEKSFLAEHNQKKMNESVIENC